MDKRREVLEKLVEGKYNYTDPRVKKDKMDIALTALDKLEKEKMLEMVGEEKNASNRSRDVMHHTDGYNQAKAEIRKKINQPQVKERRV